MEKRLELECLGTDCPQVRPELPHPPFQTFTVFGVLILFLLLCHQFPASETLSVPSPALPTSSEPSKTSRRRSGAGGDCTGVGLAHVNGGSVSVQGQGRPQFLDASAGHSCWSGGSGSWPGAVRRRKGVTHLAKRFPALLESALALHKSGREVFIITVHRIESWADAGPAVNLLQIPDLLTAWLSLGL